MAAALVSGCAYGQTKFEVASIKLCPPGSQGFNSANGGGTPGRVRIVCQSLRALITGAYVFNADDRSHPVGGRLVPIEKGPSWLNTDLYTVEAKAPGTPRPEVMLGSMMRALLEERFKLKLGRRFEEIPVYEMTVATGGHKLQPSAGTCRPLTSYEPFVSGKGPISICGLALTTGQTWRLAGATMSDFAAALSNGSDRLVVDKTGVAGTFDAVVPLTAEFADMLAPRAPGVVPPPPAQTDMADLRRMLAQKLGLRLTPAKGQGLILVVDSVQKPTEN